MLIIGVAIIIAGGGLYYWYRGDGEGDIFTPEYPEPETERLPSMTRERPRPPNRRPPTRTRTSDA